MCKICKPTKRDIIRQISPHRTEREAMIVKTDTVTVKTITIGLKGKKALASRGIKSSLIKIDFTQSENGCQYGLRFNERDYREVISILRENGIEYGAYRAK